MSGSLLGWIALGCIAAGIPVLIFYGTGNRPNTWPALGTDLPRNGFGMVWWKNTWLGSRRSPSVPEVDEALGPHYDILTVDHEVEKLRHRHHGDDDGGPGGHHEAASWMELPHAFEQAGLVDAPPDGHHAPSPRRRRRGRRTHGH